MSFRFLDTGCSVDLEPPDGDTHALVAWDIYRIDRVRCGAMHGGAVYKIVETPIARLMARSVYHAVKMVVQRRLNSFGEIRVRSCVTGVFAGHKDVGS